MRSLAGEGGVFQSVASTDVRDEVSTMDLRNSKAMAEREGVEPSIQVFARILP